MRSAKSKRITNETSIAIEMDLDGPALCKAETGIAFLDHMLDAFARHGRFNLSVKAAGDLAIDPHHTCEDIGIVIGTTIKKALGDGAGIRRFGNAMVPMDESLACVALDCSQRGYLVFSAPFSGLPVGGLPPSIFEHFFYSLCINAGITAHIKISGRDDHHMAEAAFKAFAIALSDAVRIDAARKEIPSTKGML
jgi:imidazoleglycerol-phosphate dehydratase